MVRAVIQRHRDHLLFSIVERRGQESMCRPSSFLIAAAQLPVIINVRNPSLNSVWDIERCPDCAAADKPMSLPLQQIVADDSASVVETERRPTFCLGQINVDDFAPFFKKSVNCRRKWRERHIVFTDNHSRVIYFGGKS